MQLGDSSRFDPKSHGGQSQDGEGEDERERCYWCQQDHNLRDCAKLLSWEDIRSFRETIETSDEPADAKVSSS
jgi:hypothetical protein